MAKHSDFVTPTVVLPSLLLWAPGTRDSDIEPKITCVDALQLSSCDGQPDGYYVQHYEMVPDSWGQAFGPYALDQILRFCRCLKGRLASLRFGGEDGALLCLTTGVDEAAHTNASVLLGAYLILVEDWSAKRVADVLGKNESQRKFPCAWAKLHVRTSSWLMTVRCCWEGLEVAKEQGWINPDCLRSDELTEKFCLEYRNISTTYDAAWIIPGEILVSADPVTTMCDPNPSTFCALFSSDNKPERVLETNVEDVIPSSAWRSKEVISAHPIIEETLHDLPRLLGCESESMPLSKSIPSSTHTSHPETPRTADTVCKTYVAGGQFFNGNSIVSSAMPYSKFVQECGISMIIRANFDQEPGMPMQSYNPQRWKERDIGHRNIQFDDYAGGLPLPSSVASLLETADKMSTESPGAVLIHCKGGFGRSVVLCCCLAIYKYDLPGSSLLGWSRIARPGAITTPLQEQFLLSMKGRADVLKFAKKTQALSGEKAAGNGVKVGCSPGCIVQ